MNVLRSLEEFDSRRRRGMYVACMYVRMCVYMRVCMCVCAYVWYLRYVRTYVLHSTSRRLRQPELGCCRLSAPDNGGPIDGDGNCVAATHRRPEQSQCSGRGRTYYYIRRNP